MSKILKGFSTGIHGNIDDHSHHASYKQQNCTFYSEFKTKIGHSIKYEASLRDIDLLSKVTTKLSKFGGMSLKSSLTHIWRRDTRDSPSVPTTGNLVELVSYTIQLNLWII